MMRVLDQRRRLLVAALGFAGLPMLSYDRALWALRSWLDSWPGLGSGGADDRILALEERELIRGVKILAVHQTGEKSMAIAVRAFVVLAVGLVVGSAWGQPSPSVGDILDMLRAGGYVIVFRHGATHPDQADTDPLNLDNVAKQRQLNDKGRADAKEVGAAFRAAGVPIGKSYSSRFYRAVETARLIGGKEPQVTLDVTEGGQVVSPNENNRRAQALRALVATPPDPGTNTLIVSHKPNVLDAFGKDWFEVREGEASIFKPEGSGKYAMVARVQMAQWAAARK